MFQPIYNHTFMLITFNIINDFLKTNILLQNKCPFLSYCIYIYITSWRARRCPLNYNFYFKKCFFFVYGFPQSTHSVQAFDQLLLTLKYSEELYYIFYFSGQNVPFVLAVNYLHISIFWQFFITRDILINDHITPTKTGWSIQKIINFELFII